MKKALPIITFFLSVVAVVLTALPYLKQAVFRDGAELATPPPVESPSTEVQTPRPDRAVAAREANGHVFRSASYESNCSVSVSASEGYDYVVYFKYVSQNDQRKSKDNKNPFRDAPTDDIAFYVRSGQAVELSIPEGSYKIYCAAGNGANWCGLWNDDRGYLFGDGTEYWSAAADITVSPKTTLTLAVWANKLTLNSEEVGIHEQNSYGFPDLSY